MQIAILTSSFFVKTQEIDGEDRIIFGGAERYLVQLCKLLQEAGHEVVVYQAIKGKEMLGKSYEGIPIVCIPNSDTWEYNTAPKLNSYFNESAVGADLRIYFAPFLAWPFAMRPCIVISHGVYWDYPGSPMVLNRQEYWRRQLYGVTAPNLCVSVDTNFRNVVAAIEPGAEQNIMVIPNFVDVDTFKPKEKTWEGIRVLYPRRLSIFRGINNFIVAAKKLPQYEFLICGNASNGDEEKKLVEWADETPNIRAIWQPMDRMAEIYQEADVAVIPTKASEGTSLSALESMATGLPLITTPVGGLTDLVINGYNGFVVDLNHETLIPAIQCLAENEKLRKVFGKRNRQIAQSAFSLELWKRRWKEVLGI